MSTAPKKKPAAKGTKPAAKPAAVKPAAAKGKTAAKPAAGKPAAAAAAPKKPPKEYPEMKIQLKEMAAVLFKDEDRGETIKKSGRWPLLVDLQGQAGTFLKYQDANCISCLDQDAVQPERLRLALLGGLRFGKAMVIDMDEMDMYEPMKAWFDNVQQGLLAKLLDKSIIQEDIYQTLIKDSDGEDYKNNYMYNADKFNFIIVTSKTSPNPELIEQTYTIEVGG